LKVAPPRKAAEKAEKKMIVTEMAFAKSTKGTHVFTDESDNTPITTLYIKRHGFVGDPPQTISVTVEAQ